MKVAFLACLLCASFVSLAQTKMHTLTILNSGPDCSIRGMSIPGDNLIWVSGTNGQVARSTNAGKSWKWMTVQGFEKTDFRDIHAFDSNTAIIMGIGNPAYILKTKDGGQNWKTVFTKDKEGMFLDALDFKDNQEGICIGDPVDAGGGKAAFFLIRTHDAGETWVQEPAGEIPPPQKGEAVFSASGTNIALLDSKEFDYAFISGGLSSNFYLIGSNGKPNKVYPLRMTQGTESTGAFSMATDRRKKFYCIGGDYKAPETIDSNFVWTKDAGQHWEAGGATHPSGYRSCIQIIDGERLVACGTNGVDICYNSRSWRRISGEDFKVCMVSPNKKMIFFAGKEGRIALMKL